MIKYINKISTLPFESKLKIAFYPVLLIWQMPIAWFKSMLRARKLLNGQWHKYMGFDPRNAVNSLFYRTQWINLERYGRHGVSHIIGLGNYSLKNWFHLSLISSSIYASSGAVTTLISTLAWVISHLIWLDHSTHAWWVILVTMMLFFSSTAYAMAFARQNYQILGWIWFPLALYGLSTQQYALAAFAWLASGVFSITAIFFAVPVTVFLSIYVDDYISLFTLAPALVVCLVRVGPVLNNGSYNTLIDLAKLIGAKRAGVRYRRDSSRRLTLSAFYFAGLYIVAIVFMLIASDHLALFPLLGLVLLIINERFFRVADIQSLVMIMASLFTFDIMLAEPDAYLMLGYWLAISPLGAALSIQSTTQNGKLSGILVNPPFDHTFITTKIESFLEPINSGERVYFAFEDPGGRYENIFDGYRLIHELPLYVAACKEVHLFPDWWAVAETNYDGAPQCWGRSPDEVIDSLKHWQTSYAIIYQAAGTELEAIWRDHFRQLGVLDWKEIEPLFNGRHLWPKELDTPKWFLLELIDT